METVVIIYGQACYNVIFTMTTRIQARKVPGTPVLYLHGNAPVLEKPSGYSEKSAEQAEDSRINVSEHHGAVLKELKTEAFGEEEMIKKKRKKGKKGPNPLSCKKKQKKNAADPLKGVENKIEKRGRKRNRHKKKPIL